MDRYVTWESQLKIAQGLCRVDVQLEWSSLQKDSSECFLTALWDFAIDMAGSHI